MPIPLSGPTPRPPSLTSTHAIDLSHSGTERDGFYFMTGSIASTDQILARISMMNLRASLFNEIEYLHSDGTWKLFTTTAQIKRLWTGIPSGDTSIEYNAQLGLWYMLHTAYLAPQIFIRTPPRLRDRGPRLRRCTDLRSRLTVVAMPSRPTPSSPPATRRSW